MIEWAEVVTDQHQERVRVAVLRDSKVARSDFRAPPIWLNDFVGLSGKEILRRGEGAADSLLATWLGYHSSELTLFGWHQQANS
jgi:hypothetical protein